MKWGFSQPPLLGFAVLIVHWKCLRKAKNPDALSHLQRLTWLIWFCGWIPVNFPDIFSVSLRMWTISPFAVSCVSLGPEASTLAWILVFSSSRYAWEAVTHTAKQRQRAIRMHTEVRGALWWRCNHFSFLVCSVFDQIERSQLLISKLPGKGLMAAVWNVK